MSLKYEEFCVLARKFAEISDSLDDGWRLREDADGIQYLYKKVYHSTSKDLQQCVARNTSNEPDSNNAQLISSDGEDHRETFIWEYNVVHSVSYEVPALYFNVSRLGCATPLSLEEVWNFCRAFGAVLGMDKDDLWSTITQQEHPVTAIPHFVLHPCNTQKMMQQLSHTMDFDKGNYLLTWISSFGPAVGLRIPIDYLKSTHQAQSSAHLVQTSGTSNHRVSTLNENERI